jgi:spermidine/putrescine-binding protein
MKQRSGTRLLCAILLAVIGFALPAHPALHAQTPPLASELYVYNWSDYMDEELLAEYEAQYGVRIIYDNYASMEEMLAKLQAGAEYDLIMPSDYTIARMIELGLLQKLDFANLPNVSNIRSDFKNLWYDPEDAYCVPFMWGSTGLAVSEQAGRVPDSWAAIFNPEESAWYAEQGGIHILDDQREVIGAALKYLGYSVNTTSQSEIEAARDLIIEAMPNIRFLNSSDYPDTLLIAGEVVLSQAWDGASAKAAINTVTAEHPMGVWKHIIPKEGTVRFSDAMCIPASSPRKATAEHFMNFLLVPENSVRITNFTGYSSANEAAMKLAKPELLAILPSQEDIDKMEWIQPLDEATGRLYDQIWTEIRVASGL